MCVCRCVVGLDGRWGMAIVCVALFFSSAQAGVSSVARKAGRHDRGRPAEKAAGMRAEREEEPAGGKSDSVTVTLVT